MKLGRVFSMKLDERRIVHLLEDNETKKRLEKLLAEGDCYPAHVVIHPTMRCNHRCDFCNYFHNLDKHKEATGNAISPTGIIEKQDLLLFLEEFEKCGVKSLIISGGGDPLLHKDIKTILLRALQFSYDKHIYTNLDFKLDPETIDNLARFSSVNVNINTVNEEMYRRTRGRNASLEQVRYNLQNLKEREAILNAVIIVRNNTLSMLEETLESLDQLGFGSVVVSPAFDLDYIDGIKTNEQTLESLQRVKEVVSNKKVRIVNPVEEAVVKNGEVYCRTHYLDITIGADYNIYPCCMTAYGSGFRLVNLRKFGSFIEAWNSHERRTKVNNLQFNCKTCWFGSVNNQLLKLGLK